MAETPWDLIHMRINVGFLLLDTSVFRSGQSTGPETGEVTAAAPAEREAAPGLICHQVPLALGTPLS